MLVGEEHGDETVASRKLAAAELRRARKAGRDQRTRLFSDSTDEIPKGILKNKLRIPTKRSASECIDDLSQIMEDLDLNIHDLPKANSKFCLRHQFFVEEDEDEEDDEEKENNENDLDEHQMEHSAQSRNKSINNYYKFGRECDCDINFGDNDEKPKKSVRFDERVYELKFASKLYDRRAFGKYRFSSRHHPRTSNQSSKSKKHNNHGSSKSEKGKNDFTASLTSLKSDGSHVAKPTKSQRAKQSKRDKKRLAKKEDTFDLSSDDQGYCSTSHSFSD